jgi:hypothetical protein
MHKKTLLSDGLSPLGVGVRLLRMAVPMNDEIHMRRVAENETLSPREVDGAAYQIASNSGW